VTELLVEEEQETAVLAHFDAAAILSVLSPGIVVLDTHLCAVYANRRAERLLALRLEEVRGRPLPDLLQEPLAAAVRSALKDRARVSNQVVAYASHERDPVDGPVSVRAAPLYSPITGTHVLLEFHRNSERELWERPSRSGAAGVEFHVEGQIRMELVNAP